MPSMMQAPSSLKKPALLLSLLLLLLILFIINIMISIINTIMFQEGCVVFKGNLARRQGHRVCNLKTEDQKKHLGPPRYAREFAGNNLFCKLASFDFQSKIFLLFTFAMFVLQYSPSKRFYFSLNASINLCGNNVFLLNTVFLSLTLTSLTCFHGLILSLFGLFVIWEVKLVKLVLKASSHSIGFPFWFSPRESL